MDPEVDSVIGNGLSIAAAESKGKWIFDELQQRNL